MHEAAVDRVPPPDSYKNLREPPDGFDSVIGPLTNDIKYKGVVVYDDGSAYPEYLLTYSYPK